MEHIILFHQFGKSGVGRRLETIEKYKYCLDAQMMNMLTPNLDQTHRIAYGFEPK